MDCGLADGDDVGDAGRRVAEHAAGEGSVDEQAGIGASDRGTDNLQEVGAKRGERTGQWAFLGSDQADRPVSTSILRKRRLTICSPFCCAQR